MDAEVRRLDSMGQKSILMKAMKLFVEHDKETESHTNCIEVSSYQLIFRPRPSVPFLFSKSLNQIIIIIIITIIIIIITRGNQSPSLCQVGSEFDFDLVTQILLSESEPCPAKPGFSLVKVVRKP